ncbi:MAG: hypothetical protein AVO39_03975 [delta proteobacterium MLS_D]|jgi:ribonuclease D|nr:MAG: hypothetical protein AVO39_03975 [delta proteobacterium MLS_D]
MNGLSWILVSDHAGLEEARFRIASAAVLGVDTEYDSFRYFREKLCLIQVSTDSMIYLFDPLGEDEFGFLGDLFQNPDVIKVLHACDNDVRILNRDYGFTFSSLFDTQRAASLLGSEALSLSAVLLEYLNFELPKSKKIQRSRWDLRPLDEEQLEYAARDAGVLIPLYRVMNRLLEEHSLADEAQRIFSEMADGRWREKTLSEHGHMKIEGYQDLDEAARRRLRLLYRWRFEKARSTNKARFMILSDQALLDIAGRGDEFMADPAAAGVLTRHQLNELGDELLDVLSSTTDPD